MREGGFLLQRFRHLPQVHFEPQRQCTLRVHGEASAEPFERLANSLWRGRRNAGPLARFEGARRGSSRSFCRRSWRLRASSRSKASPRAVHMFVLLHSLQRRRARRSRGSCGVRLVSPSPASSLALRHYSPDPSSGRSTCRMRPLGWMSTWRSGPLPELTNLCGTPAGTTTIWPPLTSIVASPTVKVT